MKKSIFILMFCLTGMTAMAQTTRTIKGAVIDKNGNPLPGATVEATGGAESTTVDADGTYSLEVPIWLKSVTAKYAGMKSKKMKLTGDNIIFTLKQEPKMQWFANVVGGVATCRDRMDATYDIGIMGGRLGKWGYYLKSYWTYDEKKGAGIPSVTIGAIKRICKPMYAYLGAGYGHLCHGEFHSESHYSSYSNTTVYNNYTSFEWSDGVAFDGGFIFKPFKHIDISIGATLKTDFVETTDLDVMLGVGYVF